MWEPDRIVSLLVSSGWKATLILIGVWALSAALRHRSASARHLAWLAGMAALIALPALSTLMPAWRVDQRGGVQPMILRFADLPSQMTAAQAPAPVSLPPARRTMPKAIAGLWLAGVLVVLGRLLAGLGRVYWLGRRGIAIHAEPLAGLTEQIGLRRPVKLLESDRTSMPMTWGVSRPVILLPHGASGWPAERLRVVVAHELIHVHRLDFLTQSLAHVACALYWFHPLAWLAAARLRQEREHACDDGVLRLGARATEYAEHLVELTKLLQGAAASPAVAMAERSQLEGRVLAMLDRKRNRGPVTRLGAAATVLVAACVLLPLAVLRAPAQQGGGQLVGVVKDISGAVVPGVTVVVSNTKTGRKEITTTTAAGEFGFPVLPEGNYTLDVKARGFKGFTHGVEINANQRQQTDVMLQMGEVSENIDVVGNLGPKPVAPMAPAGGPKPQRIRVGGNVQATKLVRQDKPNYPEELQRQGVQGTVMLQAVIGTNGSLLSVRPLNELVHPDLVKAAMEAVNQWQYQPTLLNGVPVEVVTIITVNYKLAQ